MMEWRLANLKSEYRQKTGKILSARKIASDTGLSKTTITDMSTGKRKSPNENTMNTLLSYLSKMLERELTTDDLWHFENISVIASDNISTADIAALTVDPADFPPSAKE